MRKNLFFILICFIWSNISFADTYTAKGSVPCGTIISYNKSDPNLTKAMMTAYVNGFITGRNYELNSKTGKGKDHDSIYYALLKYCNENPLDTNVDAAEYIYKELDKR